jgi:hypothetical protein
LGKRKERPRVGGKEFPGSTHEGLLIIPAVQVDPARGQYWSTGSKGDLHSWATETMKEAEEI